MKKMTEQEIFDAVVEHARKQNCPAIVYSDDGDKCAYRTTDGLMCFVGCLIPDSSYDPIMEEQPIEDILPDFGENEVPFDEKNLDLLKDLQHIHDNCFYGLQSWENEFQHLAAKHGFNYSVD